MREMILMGGEEMKWDACGAAAGRSSAQTGARLVGGESLVWWRRARTRAQGRREMYIHKIMMQVTARECSSTRRQRVEAADVEQ